MLFNSYEFLFVFLPIVLGLSYLAGARWGRSAVFAVLIVASFVFVALSSLNSALLLAVSMTVNVLFLSLLNNLTDKTSRNLALFFSVTFNIGFIGFFKYYSFVIENTNRLAGLSLDPSNAPELPVAISFYTFQFVALNVDVWRRSLNAPAPVNTVLFTSFFPQLVAGPIVRYQQVSEQLRRIPSFDLQKFETGFVFLSIGLFKKCVVADGLAVHANRFFDGVAQGRTPMLLEAWFGVLAYTFQIYFDFSGYSDIAVGLALFFGISLPLNFLSPYKAYSIIDFWRRWHITLSSFLRDYLYIPLGGNRRGPFRRWINLATTMTLGGLWHGASWNFVLWGAFHGFGLAINHAFRQTGIRIPVAMAWLLTFVFVCSGWVLFRTPDLEDAQAIYLGMMGFNGIMLPSTLASVLPGGLLGFDLWTFGSSELVRLTILPSLALAAAIAFFGRRADEIAGSLQENRERSPRMGLVLGAAAGLAVLAVPETTEYIYFRF